MDEQAALEAVWGDNVSHPKNYTKVEGTWLCGFPSKIYPGHHGKHLTASSPISSQRLESKKERQGVNVIPG